MSSLTLSDLLGANATRNGTAQVVNGILQLTSDVNGVAASTFYNTPVDTDGSFQTTFQFQIGGSDGTEGADGIVLLLHNDAAGPNALGGSGGDIGYLSNYQATITPALALEIDTYFNVETGDSGENTIELISYDANGTRSILSQQGPNFDLNDGSAYTVWFDYQAVENGVDVIQVFVGAAGAPKPEQALIAHAIELPLLLGSSAYIGFTSGTANSRNFHEIESFSFSTLDQPVFTKGEEGIGYFNYEQFTRASELDFGIVIPFDRVDINEISISLLFDETYYLCQNPDVASAVAHGTFSSGYEHFIASGWLEGRNPSILFDEDYYLSQYSDVAQAIAIGEFSSGFQHYVLDGHEDGRNPSEAFNEQAYLAAYSDVQAAVNQGLFISGFEHYIEFGAPEGRQPQLILFEEAFYLSQNPDVAAAVASDVFDSGFDHYVLFGQGEQRDPSVLFDESAYLAVNPDVAAVVGAGGLSSGFQHYILAGRCEGRSPDPA